MEEATDGDRRADGRRRENRGEKVLERCQTGEIVKSRTFQRETEEERERERERKESRKEGTREVNGG